MRPEVARWWGEMPGVAQRQLVQAYWVAVADDAQHMLPRQEIAAFLNARYDLEHPPQAPAYAAQALGAQNWYGLQGVANWQNAQVQKINLNQPGQAGYFNLQPPDREEFGDMVYPAEREEPDLMPKEWKCLNDFKVGTDPEFCVLDPHGQARYVGDFLPHDGPVGYDHGGRIAEFRPAPSKSTWRLVQNIWRLMKDPGKTGGIENYKWRAGAIFGAEVLGGHVHLDIKYEKPGAQTPEFIERIQALDRLTLQLEELDILPRNESRKRRQLGHKGNLGDVYGAFGNIRPAGRLPRVEYRTPASWLYSPKTAFAVLTAYKLATVEPKVALEMLTKEPSTAQVKKFLRAFSTRDDDAKLLDEKFLSQGGLKTVRGDVDADCRKTWEELPA